MPLAREIRQAGFWKESLRKCCRNLEGGQTSVSSMLALMGLCGGGSSWAELLILWSVRCQTLWQALSKFYQRTKSMGCVSRDQNQILSTSWRPWTTSTATPAAPFGITTKMAWFAKCIHEHTWDHSPLSEDTTFHLQSSKRFNIWRNIFLNKKKRENVSIPTYLLLDTRDHWLWHGCPRRRKRKDAVGDRREREKTVRRRQWSRPSLELKQVYHPSEIRCLEEEESRQ